MKMKAIFKISISMAILMIATMVCNAQNGGGQSNGVGIKVKSGNLAFKMVEDGQEEMANFIFDDYGASFRLEFNDECSIADATAQKAYKLNHADKTYSEEDSFSVLFSLYLLLYVGDNEIAKEYPGYKKLSNRTIAGKSCTAFSFTNDSKTTTLAGWKGLLFFKEEPKSSFLATSFSETVPANSFVIPADYKLVKKEDAE